MTRKVEIPNGKVFLTILITILTYTISTQAIAQSVNINSLSANKGSVGYTISITGSGFDSSPSNMAVWFGAVQGNIVSTTNSFIEVSVPAGATYDNIVVTNKSTGMSASSPLPFSLTYGGETFNTGKLSSITDFNTENGLYDLCLCDFNSDGKVDIATANDDSNFITLLTNTSTFNTTSFNSSSIAVNAKTLNVKCKDLDADGKPEILLTRTGNTTSLLYYLKNTTISSTITFASPVPLTIDGTTIRKVDSEDLDLDGKPEIIVTNQSNNAINIFYNNSTAGAVNFSTTPITVDISSLPQSTGLFVKDLNGDDMPEIGVSSFAGPNIYILKNTSSSGSVSFAEAQTIPLSGSITNVLTGDLNNDGKRDIITNNLNNSKINILENISGEDGGTIDFNQPIELSTNSNPWGLEVGDLNGDGKLDLAIASISTSSIDVFINNSSSSITFVHSSISTNENSRNLKIGDINGDGKPDLSFTSIDSDMISTIINQNCVTPTIYNDNNIALCDGASLRLEAVNALNVNYKWYKDSGSGEVLVKDNNESFYEENVTVGNYQFRVAALGEGGTCVESSQIIDVTVSAGTTPSPPTIVNPGKGCEGESVTITLDPSGLPPGATFTWITPSGNVTDTSVPSLTINNLSSNDAGVYEVEVKDGPCVSESATTILELVILSNITIANSSTLDFCEGLSTQLSVPNTAGYSYQWKKNGSNITSAMSNTLSVNESGDYSVTITTPETCEYTTDAVTVNVYAPPVAGFNSVNQTCTATNIEFTNTSTVDNSIDVTYEWDFDDGNTSTEENPIHSFSNVGTYDVSLTTSYDANCKHTVSIAVEVFALPDFEITTSGPSTTICAGETLTLTAAEGFEPYLWDSDETTNEITVSEPGTYSVEATSDKACPVTAQIEIEVLPLPEITITSTQNGNEFQLEAEGGIRYEWEADNTLSALGIPNPIAKPESTNTYSVTGFNENGCSSMATITLEINESDAIPPFFTPNGDSDNDFWVIRNIEDYVDCTLIVFNRAGQIVFEKKNYANDWDGTHKGDELQQGVYYYMIKCDNSSDNAVTGSVAILR